MNKKKRIRQLERDVGGMNENIELLIKTVEDLTAFVHRIVEGVKYEQKEKTVEDLTALVHRIIEEVK